MDRLRGLWAGVPGGSDQAGYRTGPRKSSQAQCRFCEDLAEHYGQEGAARGRQGLGRCALQIGDAVLTQPRNRRLVRPLTSRDENVMLKCPKSGPCGVVRL